MSRRRITKVIWIALACAALLPVASLGLMSVFSRKPDNLGATNGRLAACPSSPNCVSSQAEDAPHRVDPLPLNGTAAEAMARLKSVIRSTPRAKIVMESDGYLHAEFASLLFRFVDDVEFLADEPDGVIHVRSASRVGYSDFGVNRKRVEAIRAKYLERPAG